MHPTRSAAKAVELYGAAGGTNPLAELIEVHDGIIAHLDAARRAIAEGRIEDRLTSTRKIASVVDVLQMSLDHDHGGDIAANLDRLYRYFTRRLSEINVKNDAAICEELIERFAELRDGWRAVIADGSPVPPPAPTGGASLSA